MSMLSLDQHGMMNETSQCGAPDLVIVDEKKITDIFELKFAPHHCPDRWEEDIPKLLGYVTNADRQKCPVSLDPVTGQLEKRWAEYSQERLQVPDDCRAAFRCGCKTGLPSSVAARGP